MRPIDAVKHQDAGSCRNNVERLPDAGVHMDLRTINLVMNRKLDPPPPKLEV